MDSATGPPPGFHSIFGDTGGLFVTLYHSHSSLEGDLNYAEYVTYDEASILPYAIVYYTYRVL